MTLITVPGTYTVTTSENSIFGGTIDTDLQPQCVWLDFTNIPPNGSINIEVYVAIPGDSENLLRRYFRKNYNQRALFREPMVFIPFIPCDLFDVRVHYENSPVSTPFQLRYARVYQQQ